MRRADLVRQLGQKPDRLDSPFTRARSFGLRLQNAMVWRPAEYLAAPSPSPLVVSTVLSRDLARQPRPPQNCIPPWRRR